MSVELAALTRSAVLFLQAAEKIVKATVMPAIKDIDFYDPFTSSLKKNLMILSK